MTKFISVDQSMASCAVTYWIDGTPVDKKIFKTGSSWSTAKQKDDVVYLPIITQQIDYIVSSIYNEALAFEAEYVILEGAALSGFGSAVAVLKTLARAVEETFKFHGFDMNKYVTITPTALKSYARNFLPEDEQTGGVLKSGKLAKIKMDKNLMYRACKLTAPEGWLDKNSVSNGGGDLADSFWLGHKTYHEVIK